MKEPITLQQTIVVAFILAGTVIGACWLIICRQDDAQDQRLSDIKEANKINADNHSDNLEKLENRLTGRIEVVNTKTTGIKEEQKTFSKCVTAWNRATWDVLKNGRHNLKQVRQEAISVCKNPEFVSLAQPTTTGGTAVASLNKSSSKSQNDRPITKQQVKSTIDNVKPDINKCYQRERQRQNNSKLAARVDLKFEISSTGEPFSIKIHNSHKEICSLEECVKDIIKRIRFPASSGSVLVNYPFHFKPGLGAGDTYITSVSIAQR